VALGLTTGVPAALLASATLLPNLHRHAGPRLWRWRPSGRADTKARTDAHHAPQERPPHPLFDPHPSHRAADRQQPDHPG
jgi:hypothetical protein